MATLIIALPEHQEQHKQAKDCLEQAGYEVVVVDSFPRAKKLLKKHLFDREMAAELLLPPAENAVPIIVMKRR